MAKRNHCRGVASGVSINAHAVISRAVEEGVRYGYQRAHKHSTTPTEDTILESVEREVMNALAEVLDYGDSE